MTTVSVVISCQKLAVERRATLVSSMVPDSGRAGSSADGGKLTEHVTGRHLSEQNLTITRRVAGDPYSAFEDKVSRSRVVG